MTEKEPQSTPLKEMTFMEKLKEFDESNSEKIHNMEMDEHTNIFLFLSEKLYRPVCLAVYLGLIFLYDLLRLKHPLLIWKPIVHIAVVHFVCPLLQSAIRRPKPKWEQKIKKPNGLTVVAEQFSMPCGEVMQAANFGVFLILCLHNFAGVFIIPLVMIGKIYYSYYYLLDTVVSALLGGGISLVLFICLTRL